MRGAWGKRILLFVATNVAVLLVLSVALRLLRIESYLDERGVGLDLQALLIIAAVVGFTGAFISLAISKWVAKHFTRARVISPPRTEAEIWLVGTVERLARQAGIGRPEVAIFPSPDPNAFATGARRNHSLVAVSEGLLRLMRKDEIEAVLAHEVSHVANGDMVTLTLIQGVVNTFVIFLSRVVGYTVDRLVFRTERGHGPGFWITTLVAQLLLGILASLIVMGFSRRREYRADGGSAELVGAPPMIAALERLRATRELPSMLPDSLQAFGIRSGPGQGFARLFSSHPPLEERIAALRARASRV